MKKSELERIENLIARFRITKGKDFSLNDIDPGDTGDLKSADKAEAKEMQVAGVSWIAEQQDMLYAQDHWALLLVFQAMDAAGKDGTIKHVTSGINPQGCEVTSFKQPSAEELDHDYLWRYMRHVPARGQIGIFNRSYYEEVLVVKVHQEIARAREAAAIAGDERHLERALRGHREFRTLSDPQRCANAEVLPARVERGTEATFYRAAERAGEELEIRSQATSTSAQHWDEYQAAYEEAIHNTASKHAPWYVVPADNKWFTRLVVLSAVIKAIADLELTTRRSAPKRKRNWPLRVHGSRRSNVPQGCLRRMLTLSPAP